MDEKGDVVWKTGIKNWFTYTPASRDLLKWYLPEIAQRSPRTPALRAAGNGPQREIIATTGTDAESIWHTPKTRSCYIFSIYQ